MFYYKGNNLEYLYLEISDLFIYIYLTFIIKVFVQNISVSHKIVS